MHVLDGDVAKQVHGEVVEVPFLALHGVENDRETRRQCQRGNQLASVVESVVGEVDGGHQGAACERGREKTPLPARSEVAKEEEAIGAMGKRGNKKYVPARMSVMSTWSGEELNSEDDMMA